MDHRLHFEILPQPNNTTCGPTCLHAVYRYHGEELPLPQVIRETQVLQEGGTLAVMLGCDALRRGYDVSIDTFNLQVFDPTWFKPNGDMIDRSMLIDKLGQQAAAKHRSKLKLACHAYIELLQLGGRIRMEDLTPSLLRRYLKQDIPLLTGLSATYLYRESREISSTDSANDVLGEPSGHFVVLCGYDKEKRSVLVADPWELNPISSDHIYVIDMDRVICSILLGILTYDANLLIVRKKNHPRP
ncbi:MAG: C39 family peptidase [Planctomycetaceae bacterium]|nr:C39 family peptidase [Planctomycetaceae bacterium]